MILLLWLLLAHIIGDFYVQKSQWVQDRQRRHARSIGLLKHVSTHLLLTSLALTITFLTSDIIGLWQGVVVLLCVVVSHFLIDVVKSYARENAATMLVDQLAHLLVIVGLWLWVSGYDLPVLHSNHLLLALLYLFAARPMSFLIAAILRKQASALETTEETTGLVEAGRLIGYIERWLIISFVLLDQFMAIGFLLAAKSIFRFGDLRHPHEQRLTEYMLLGSLLSF